MEGFAHLHLHTEYSLLDGFARTDELFSACKEKGIVAVACTDHGVMFGAVDFYIKAKEAGVKPIIGCEVYVAPNGIRPGEPNQDKERHHLILLCKNETGYQNLIKLCSIAHEQGYYYKPRVDMALLEQYAEGLICLTACKAGGVQSAILMDDFDLATKRALELRRIYGDNFYLELQYHGLSEQIKINRGLLYLSKEYGIPVVATNDVHYIEKEDARAHDVLLCIQTGQTLTEDRRMKFPNSEFYLKSAEEMRELFREVPEAIENTLKIAKECQFSFDFDSLHLPRFHTDIDLRALCYEKLEKKQLPHDVDMVRERLEYELDVIYKMGYADYMLIVQDFIAEARKMGVAVGPGRGSGGGSLVSYLLEITDIDPFQYDLIFERFLNPERVTMPDIDVDFDDERRLEVIDYVKRAYGEHHVAQIITFGTLAARAAIKDVARVMGLPGFMQDKLVREIPGRIGITLEKAKNENPKLVALLDSDDELRHVFEIAEKLEGMPRHASTHAAGVVITHQPVDHYVPLYLNNTTQYTMGALARLGLLKMDFLGIRTLSVIKHTVERLNARGIFIDIDEQKKEVYDYLQTGDTIGLFQLESVGFRRFFKQLKPVNIEDIVAAISLYRPGPMQNIPIYLENRLKGVDTYKCPELEPILKDTHGVMVYQEQVMRIARDLAGYTYGRSDILRNAMAKKKKDIMDRERPIFVEGCVKNGISKQTAEELFVEMEEFAKYAFNKIHAVGYAILAYRTAYLKALYPLEYMASLLTSVIAHKGLMTRYLNECLRMKIAVLPPCVNNSGDAFRIEGDAIRFSLSSVKGIGSKFVQVLEQVREEGPFLDFQDFLERMPTGELKKSTMECLILSGAFDCFGHTRTTLMGNYEFILKHVSETKKRVGENQLNLFADAAIPPPKLYAAPEYKIDDKLAFEKDLLGVYLTGHPIDAYKDFTDAYSTMSLTELYEQSPDEIDGINFHIALMVVESREQYTKKGELMMYLRCEDSEDEIEVVVFPSMTKQYHGERFIFVSGVIQASENRKTQLVARRIQDIESVKKKGFTRFVNRREFRGTLRYVFKPNEKGKYEHVKQVLHEISQTERAAAEYYKIEYEMATSGNVMVAYERIGLDKAQLRYVNDIVGEPNIKYTERKRGEEV